MIFSHLSPEYKALKIPHGNGAFYYSKEICERIIPKIKTDRNWVTINVEPNCWDNSIVFIHNNKKPERYEWLKNYKNLILVCSQIKTLKFMQDLLPKTHSILIPLSVDVEYVKQFKAKRKTKNCCYFGRLEKMPKDLKEKGVDVIEGETSDRDELLKKVAIYKNVYAIGRCAIEAKILGCNVTSHKGEYVNTKFDIIDNEDIIPELQRLINEIDEVNK